MADPVSSLPSPLDIAMERQRASMARQARAEQELAMLATHAWRRTHARESEAVGDSLARFGLTAIPAPMRRSASHESANPPNRVALADRQELESATEFVAAATDEPATDGAAARVAAVVAAADASARSAEGRYRPAGHNGGIDTTSLYRIERMVYYDEIAALPLESEAFERERVEYLMSITRDAAPGSDSEAEEEEREVVSVSDSEEEEREVEEREQAEEPPPPEDAALEAELEATTALLAAQPPPAQHDATVEQIAAAAAAAPPDSDLGRAWAELEATMGQPPPPPSRARGDDTPDASLYDLRRVAAVYGDSDQPFLVPRVAGPGKSMRAKRMSSLLGEMASAGSHHRQAYADFLEHLLEQEPPHPSRAVIEAWRCPITLAPFRHPVVAADGGTYEKEALQRHMATCVPFRSPLTNERIDPVFFECHSICAAIAAFVEAELGGCTGAAALDEIAARLEAREA